jgi:hypothetical protein
VAETANDLVLKCTAIARDGADFPTVWEALSAHSASVFGKPIAPSNVIVIQPVISE